MNPNPFTRYWPATILVTTVLAAQASAGTDFRPATPGSQGMSSEALEALAGLIRGYVEQDTVVGAELVVIKNRRLVFHAPSATSARCPSASPARRRRS
ncbi:MAG: hypothetical protein ACYTAQ_14125 [Planctomycetota bacterium]|jgi:hypothetical protein